MVSTNMLDYLSQCDDLDEFAAVSFWLFFWNWKHICIQFELWLSTFCCCCCCCCHRANAHCMLLLLLLFVAYVCTHRTLWGCFNMRLYGCSSKTRLEKMHSRKSDEPQRLSVCVCVCVCVLMNDFLEQKKKEPLSTFNTLALTQTSY